MRLLKYKVLYYFFRLECLCFILDKGRKKKRSNRKKNLLEDYVNFKDFLF